MAKTPQTLRTADACRVEDTTLSPSDYFYQLAADKIVVNIFGEHPPQTLIRLTRQAEESAPITIGGRKARISPLGAQLQKQPEMQKYQLQVTRDDGLRAFLSPGNSPRARLILGAPWCMSHPIEEAAAVAEEVARALGICEAELQLSALDLRVDVPHPFVMEDEELMRGTLFCGRGRQIRLAKDQGKFTGFRKAGASKILDFIIYDKRHSVRKRQNGALSAACMEDLWQQCGIAEGQSVWRVEGRWKRKGLRRRGLYHPADLTAAKACELWHHFSRKRLLLVADPEKRTSRAGIDPRWKKIQQVASGAPAATLGSEELSASVRQDKIVQLLKQAAGCIDAAARMAAGDGTDRTDLLERWMVMSGIASGTFLGAALRVHIGVDGGTALEDELARLGLLGEPQSN